MPLSEQFATGERFMGIRLLGNLRLSSTQLKGLRLAGISALGWDEDEALLYALSDLGHVFHLRPRFDGEFGEFLSDVEILDAYALQDEHGRALVKPWKDAEGLALKNAANGIGGDTELLVCFEVKQRIRRYTPTGKRLGGVELPPPLRAIERFVNPNVALEAIALLADGTVLVAPERPLRGERRAEIMLYAVSKPGSSWRYPLYPAPGSSLVALEALADGSLLALERAFTSLTRPLIIALRRTRLTAPAAAEPLTVETIAVFDTSQGWLLDNFEGLAQHRKNRFFMVSDDNRNPWQSTLLVYFELNEDQR